MTGRRSLVLVGAMICAVVCLMVAWPQAQSAAQDGARGAGRQIEGAAQAGPPQSGYLAIDKSKLQGWAVKDYLYNTLGWDASKPLWNTAKQKLLDGKQVFSWTASTNDA